LGGGSPPLVFVQSHGLPADWKSERLEAFQLAIRNSYFARE
jgi:hypothetical protein